jgi:hypothetical protein
MRPYVRLFESKDIPKRYKGIALPKSYPGFTTDEEGEKVIRNFIDSIERIPDPVMLYRIVYVDSPEELRMLPRENAHWTLEITDYLKSITKSHALGEHPYLLTATTPKSNINFQEMVENMANFEQEFEVGIKNYNKIKIIRKTPL